MRLVAEKFDTDELRVRFGQVRYLENGEKPTDAAFEVARSHDREDEMRVAVSFESAELDDRTRKEQIRSKIPEASSDPGTVPEFKCMTFVESEGYEAIILPISPAVLIQEIVIGPKVGESAKAKFIQKIAGSEIASKVRQ